VLAAWSAYGPGPCNNPVCLTDRETGVVHLLYGHAYARVFHCASYDDGLTWTAPREITATLGALRDAPALYDWGVVAVGPGHGIQLAGGRLLAPVWVSTSHSHAHQPSRTGVIYSDDHGATWFVGELVPDELPNCNEAAAVELADGRVLLSMRHQGPSLRAETVSSDGISGWARPWLDEALYEPQCYASILRWTLPCGDEPGRILYVHPDSRAAGLPGARCNLTLRVSYDEARTWPVHRVVERGPAGYADLALAPDGSILCLYEAGPMPGQPYTVPAIKLVHLDLTWLKGETCV